jgi:hypothetical protein
MPCSECWTSSSADISWCQTPLQRRDTFVTDVRQEVAERVAARIRDLPLPARVAVDGVTAAGKSTRDPLSRGGRPGVARGHRRRQHRSRPTTAARGFPADAVGAARAPEAPARRVPASRRQACRARRRPRLPEAGTATRADPRGQAERGRASRRASQSLQLEARVVDPVERREHAEEVERRLEQHVEPPQLAVANRHRPSEEPERKEAPMVLDRGDPQRLRIDGHPLAPAGSSSETWTPVSAAARVCRVGETPST